MLSGNCYFSAIASAWESVTKLETFKAKVPQSGDVQSEGPQLQPVLMRVNMKFLLITCARRGSPA